MPEYREFGVACRTLSDHIDRFCLKQGNMREAYYTKFLVMGEDIWKDMYRNTIWNIKRAVLEVCHKTHTIKTPDNCERIINISVVDRHNQLHPLTENSNYNTTEILCQKNKCSCNNCHGENTLCPVIDNLSVTIEQVTIQNNQYPLTTWIRYNPDGSLNQERRIPALDVASGAVVYQTIFTKLCNLEITNKGCIKPTTPNMQLLQTYCGWDGLGWNGIAYNLSAFRPIIPTTQNYWGEYNKNAENPTIIHIFKRERHFHQEQGGFVKDGHPNWEGIKNVILTYKTNGDVTGEEILIPEYAQMAMDTGIIYQQRALNPRDGDKDGSAYRSYCREKTKVFRYLNPVTMETMQKLQQAPHRW